MTENLHCGVLVTWLQSEAPPTQPQHLPHCSSSRDPWLKKKNTVRLFSALFISFSSFISYLPATSLRFYLLRIYYFSPLGFPFIPSYLITPESSSHTNIRPCTRTLHSRSDNLSGCLGSPVCMHASWLTDDQSHGVNKVARLPDLKVMVQPVLIGCF